MLVQNHFVECMFALNGCSAGLHASRHAGPMAGATGSALPGAWTLPGTLGWPQTQMGASQGQVAAPHGAAELDAGIGGSLRGNGADVRGKREQVSEHAHVSALLSLQRVLQTCGLL
jgi:hypothetical protein